MISTWFLPALRIFPAYPYCTQKILSTGRYFAMLYRDSLLSNILLFPATVKVFGLLQSGIIMASFISIIQILISVSISSKQRIQRDRGRSHCLSPPAGVSLILARFGMTMERFTSSMAGLAAGRASKA